mmetsp:Transcript_63521/g.171390  ORF Transcript_63521/g.171390 Transcript_63521/m.171390 type:complete len:498 (+) Transcript_63521:87-1580(+)
MGAPKGKGKSQVGKGKGGPSKGKGAGKGKTASAGKGQGKGDKTWVAVKGTVLVTGASGFIAMSCIRRLIEKGYKVRGSVRSLSNETTVGPLRKLFPTMELVEADLVGASDAWEKACEGCKYVLHTASPFQLSVGDPQKDLVDPALKGTENVVKAAMKAGVSRTVVTSSVASVGPPQSVRDDPSKGDKDKVYTEEDWNKESTLEKGPYLYSKRLAEEKAWELVKESKMELSVICPSFVLGPMMTGRRDGESAKFIAAMLEGTLAMGDEKGPVLGVCDVRDISMAHVAAMEIPGAAGKRFLCTSEKGYTRSELAATIRDRFKAYPVPAAVDKEAIYVPKWSHAQATEVLKWKPRPVEISMRDMANAAIRTGMVAKKYVLKPTKFGKAVDVMPDSKGINLLVKVVKIGESSELRDGTLRKDVVVGDASALVTIGMVGDELSVAEVGSVIEVRNAQVRMVGGYIRLAVGKWGRVSKHEGGTEVTPNESKDASATEYELVKS